MFPQVRDKTDELVAQLEELNQRLRGMDGSGDSTTFNETYNVDAGDGRGGEPVYWTTGEGGVQLDPGEEWEDMEFGFRAATVSIRTSDDVVIAFRSPYDRNTRRIPIFTPADSPFSIGGDRGIGASEIWLKEAPSAEETPVVHIIAKQ